jgi:hypothetical protein
MKKNKRLIISGLKNYEELLKINLCKHFNRYIILKNVYQPKRFNLWIDRLSEDYIHFEANVKNNDSVDFKLQWSTYLAVMANQHLN